jgi:hypothetical protein
MGRELSILGQLRETFNKWSIQMKVLSWKDNVGNIYRAGWKPDNRATGSRVFVTELQSLDMMGNPTWTTTRSADIGALVEAVLEHNITVYDPAVLPAEK